MALTTYLQLAEVRAALGVNDIELKDTVLNLPVYEMGLIRELNKISTSLPAAFSLVNAKDANARSTAEETLFEATRLFAVYAVARQVGVSLSTFAPKDISDSKATISRFAGTPYEETMRLIDQMFGSARVSLVDAYTGYTGADAVASGPFTSFVAVKRLTDPVTGI